MKSMHFNFSTVLPPPPPRSEDQKVLNKTAISIFITYRTLCYATEAAIDALLDV